MRHDHESRPGRSSSSPRRRVAGRVRNAICLNGRVETRVEELAADRVRLRVEVPSHDVRHALDHAASDLAGQVKVPGFRKGKVPLPVLVARVGKERLYTEAVESHIGGWFLDAAAASRIRPVSRPDYEYELPESAEDGFAFSATVAVQPKVEAADWTALEVPAPEPEVPEELIGQELDELRSMVAELAPVDGRPARHGDTVVVDLVAASGEAQRDYVVELGEGRLVDELEGALDGLGAGETKEVEYEAGEDVERKVSVTVKEIKERVLPPLDDELARAASEFDTLAELRADIEARLRAQLAEELEAEFRVAAVDALVAASAVRPAEELVRSRAGGLLGALVRSLEQRGVGLETYLAVTGQSPEQLQEGLRAQAERSIARELVLEAVADQVELVVSDEQLAEFVRERAREAGEEDADAVAREVLAGERRESLREDLRLRNALDRVVAEVKRIPAELARAREKLWTPEKEKGPRDTNIWTPGSKEPA